MPPHPLYTHKEGHLERYVIGVVSFVSCTINNQNNAQGNWVELVAPGHFLELYGKESHLTLNVGLLGESFELIRFWGKSTLIEAL